ncbi:MAG: hypothetical protein Q7T10_04285, partial [Rhodoferax sp.]|uniref:hypothetical protein n=1 Tax=Rhodoferax sp. TaxID=50421 RepID=UPI0027231891
NRTQAAINFVVRMRISALSGEGGECHRLAKFHDAFCMMRQLKITLDYLPGNSLAACISPQLL